MTYKQMGMTELIRERQKVVNLIQTNKDYHTVLQNKSYLTKLNREISRRNYSR